MPSCCSMIGSVRWVIIGFLTGFCSTMNLINSRSSLRTFSNSRISLDSQKASVLTSLIIGSFALICGILTFRSNRVAISRSCLCAYLNDGICSIDAMIRPYMKLSKRFAYSSLSSRRTMGAICCSSSPLSPSLM